jgi:nickel superoxide dismutase
MPSHGFEPIIPVRGYDREESTEGVPMRPFRHITIAHAHGDLMCGVYDPAQARIEAESVHACCVKYQASDDPVFRDRCILIKEERGELVKHHVSVLWTDYFKPHHLEQNPEIHDLFWKATKAAGDAKKRMDPAVAERLISSIEEVAEAFRATPEASGAGLYPESTPHRVMS